jgi:hypothetical protein
MGVRKPEHLKNNLDCLDAEGDVVLGKDTVEYHANAGLLQANPPPTMMIRVMLMTCMFGPRQMARRLSSPPAP